MAARAHLPPHIATPAGPCPTAGEPPSDYAAFEQWAGASHGERRIREWTTDDRAVRRADLVAELGVGPGESVAGVEAGEGYFLDAFARSVGPSGRVTALEVDPALVAHLRWYGDALGHAHAEARQTPLDGVDLEAGSQDVVFICEVMKAVVTNASAATPEGREAARDEIRRLARTVDKLNAERELELELESEIEERVIEHLGQLTDPAANDEESDSARWRAERRLERLEERGELDLY